MFDSVTESISFELSRRPPSAPTDRTTLRRFEEASDEELAHALLARNVEAQRVAWQRFSPLVGRMVRRVFARNDDAEEVVQEVFLCLFRRVHTLRAAVALRAFVIGMTRRIMSHERRRRRLRFYQASEGEQSAAAALRVAANPAAKHALINLQLLLARLRLRERRAFVLRFVGGMDADEVGVELGVSTPTARRSSARAWKRISVWASRDPFLSDYLRTSCACQ